MGGYSIVEIILNTYDYVEHYIDRPAPGGKEHIGHIADHTGFGKFKKRAPRESGFPRLQKFILQFIGKSFDIDHSRLRSFAGNNRNPLRAEFAPFSGCFRFYIVLGFVEIARITGYNERTL